MLERYDGKEVRVYTTDGSVFTGEAESYPSGYGLSEFDREEESIQVEDCQIFKSDILKIELLSDSNEPSADPRRYDDLMGRLLEGSCYIVDILPEQVPAGTKGQYFAVERYFLQPKRAADLRRRYAEILLRLNCYDSMAVTFDSCESWEINPDPEAFADRYVNVGKNGFLRAVFEEPQVMIDLDPYDMYITVYGTDPVFLDRVGKLAGAEGFFMWQPPDGMQ